MCIHRPLKFTFEDEFFLLLPEQETNITDAKQINKHIIFFISFTLFKFPYSFNGFSGYSIVPLSLWNTHIKKRGTF